jgi:alpha-ketoglutarate-dependent taurine dioxygenase
MGVDDVVRPRARDLTPALGAEIDGVDLTEPLSDETIGFLRDVFDDRGLLLFRRTELAQVQQYVLCEVLRGRERPSEEQADEDAAIQRNFYVSNRREGATAPIGRLLFHADGVWTDEPFEVLSLYAEEMEPNASATLVASAVNGWETMPDALRARIEGREAIQVGGPEDLHEQRRGRFGDDVMQTVRDGAPSFTLPVVRPHPRTGRMALLISENHAKEIVGLPLEESDALLDEVFAHLYAPANTYEHQWEEGDLLVWDNIALHHGRRTVTQEGAGRTLRKVGLPLPTSAALTKVTTYQLAR